MRAALLATTTLLVSLCMSCSLRDAMTIDGQPDQYETVLTDTLSGSPRKVRTAIEGALASSGYQVHRKSFLLDTELISVGPYGDPGEAMYAGTAGYDPMGNARRRALPVRQDPRTGPVSDPPQTHVLVLVFPAEIAPNTIEIKVSTMAWHVYPERDEWVPLRSPDTAPRLLLQEIRSALRR